MQEAPRFLHTLGISERAYSRGADTEFKLSTTLKYTEFVYGLQAFSS